MAYFDKYGVEFTNDRKTLVKYPRGRIGEYAIPNGVSRISAWAFATCKHLTAITIPQSVTYIGENAFRSCSKLSTIKIPDSVLYIECGAFNGCIGLIEPIYNRQIFARLPYSYDGSFVIPEGIKQIVGRAFEGCKSLSSITIPDSVNIIGDYAFLDCGKLNMPIHNSHVFAHVPVSYSDVYTIPSGIENIAGGAFAGSHVTSIVIPNSVTHIGRNAFYYCRNLTSITISENIKKIGGNAFFGCQALDEINAPSGMIPQIRKMIETRDVEMNVSNSIRSWEDLEELWLDMYHKYEKQETEYDGIVFKMLSQGQVPAAMPPIGVCLTAEEYARYKSEGQDFNKIHAWCWSGRDMHETMRLHLNTPNWVTYGENIVGVTTPRQGIYKIVRIESNNEEIPTKLFCYYIGKEVKNENNELDFLEEIVEVSASPLYNYYSDGPKSTILNVGDVIAIQKNRLQKLHRSSGSTYAITWTIENKKPVNPATYHNYDNHDNYEPSYSQYGGYNGFDDNTINSAFEGDPEATWNVD